MEKLRGKLILTRHHESDWNKAGLWQGKRDRHLTEYGFKKSEEMGKMIADIYIDHAFASKLVRSIETLSSMLEAKGQQGVQADFSAALNEREYGEYTGMNKWDMLKLVGQETWDKIRREWDYPVPGGETLRMVYARAVPFFESRILPLMREGNNVLVVAHGNTCRALRKYIEGISDEDISKVEMPFGDMLVYELDEKGHLVTKEERKIESQVNA